MLTSNPFPRYVCFKEVNGGRITGIDHAADDSAVLHFGELGPDVTIKVTDAWMVKHKPEVGGYYVIYNDDYTSYSPAQAFENGYMLKPIKDRDYDVNWTAPTTLPAEDLDPNTTIDAIAENIKLQRQDRFSPEAVLAEITSNDLKIHM